jgi:hypothetical protein
MELEFEATEDDWIALMRRQAVTPALISRVHRRNMRNCVIAGAIWVVVVGAVGYFAASNRATAPLNALVCMAVMAVVSAALSRKKITRASAQRQMEQELERLMRQGALGTLKSGTFYLALFEDCAASTFDGQTITFPWGAALPPVKHDGAMFIEFPDKGMIRIPDRVFESDGAREEFLSTVESLRVRAQGTPGEPPGR